MSMFNKLLALNKIMLIIYLSQITLEYNIKIK